MVSLKGLAEECGVAQGTVSNILADRGAYAEETRRRVIAAAKKFGYLPSRLATSLREQNSTAVGILMSNLVDPYFAELLDGLSRVLSGNGLEVMVNLSTLRPGEDVLEAYRSFLSWRLRAFLVSADNLRTVPPPADLLRVVKSTVVITLNSNPWEQCAAVMPDRKVFAELAVDHLYRLGHRRIGILSYSDDATHPKREHIVREMEKRGIALRESDVFHVKPGEGFELGRRIAAAESRPTGMIAWTDSIGVQFASGFMAGGGKIPSDLSLLSYNNTRFAAVAGLPLTAVGVPTDRFARATFELMQETIAAREAGQVEANHVMVQPELVVRESTAEAPASH